MTSMEYSTFIKTGAELMHHGILGQKWGVRRYQPYPEGHEGGKETGEAARRARHQGKLERLKMKTELAEAKNKLANAKQKNEIDEAQAKLQVAQAKAAIKNPSASTQGGNGGQQNQQMKVVANPSSEAIKQNVIRSGDPKMLKRYEKMLDNNEFRAAKERIEMRKQLEDNVRKETINRFMDKGETIVNTIKKAGSIASEAKNAYNNAVEIQNKLFPNSKWKKIKDETPMTPEQKQKLIQAIEKQDAFRQHTGFDPFTGKRAKGLYDSQGHFIRFATATEERTGIIVDPSTGISIDLNTAVGPGTPLQMLDPTSFTPTPRTTSSTTTTTPTPRTTSSTTTTPNSTSSTSTRVRGRTYRLRHADIYSDELYHHGVLGMHWGIRRFQPYRKGERVKGGKEVGQATKVKQINFAEKIQKGVHEVNKLRNTIQKGKEDKAAHKLRMKQLRDAKAEIGRARRHELMERMRMRAQEEEDKAREAKREENERRERNVERVRQVVGDIANVGAAAYGIYSLSQHMKKNNAANNASAAYQTASQIRNSIPQGHQVGANALTSSNSGRTTNTLPSNVSSAIRSATSSSSSNSSSTSSTPSSNTSNSHQRSRTSRVRDTFNELERRIAVHKETQQQLSAVDNQMRRLDNRRLDLYSRVDTLSPSEFESRNKKIQNDMNTAKEYRQALKNIANNTIGSSAKKMFKNKRSTEEVDDWFFNTNREMDRLRERYRRTI